MRAAALSESPVVAKVSIELLELGGLDVGASMDSTHVLLLRALGDVQQSAPLPPQALLQAQCLSHGGGTLVGLRDTFSFAAAFDGRMWAAGSLRRLLATEMVRIDLLQVSLLDSACWERPDLGARRIAAYHIQPWPWLLEPGNLLCDACELRRTIAQPQHVAGGHVGAGRRARVEGRGAWLRVRLRGCIAHEPPYFDAHGPDPLDPPKSGDMFEVRRWPSTYFATARREETPVVEEEHAEMEMEEEEEGEEPEEPEEEWQENNEQEENEEEEDRYKCAAAARGAGAAANANVNGH